MEPHQLTSEDQVLSNSLILANVFEFLPHQDLKSLRSVSRSWRDICTPILRRKTYVRLDSDEMLGRFLQAFATTDLLPFREFNLVEFDLQRHSDPLMDTFWKRWGPSMEAINLYEVTLVGVEIVRDILFNLCPKLKDISIVDCYFYESFDKEEGDGTQYKEIAPVDENVRINKNLISFDCGGDLTKFPISWEELFVGYPNLRNLSVHVSAATMGAILESAASLRVKDPRKFQLEKLCISYGELSSHTTELLGSLKLSLKELSIYFKTNVASQHVARLLQQQVNLEKLIVHGGEERIFTAKFPSGIRFDHLRYLRTTDNFLDSIAFVGLMPNLSTLELLGSSQGPRNNAIVRTSFNLTQIPLQTKLTDLKINYEISSLDVKKLVHWFPGVVKAELYLDNNGFRSVCVGWKNVEELNVWGKLTTEGITGIYELKLRNSEPHSDMDIPKLESPANITCLTNLRQFTMSYFSAAIDDACVDHGFMKLPRLNYLDICSTHISDEGWTKLSNWSQLQTLKASNGNWDWEGAKTFSK